MTRHIFPRRLKRRQFLQLAASTTLSNVAMSGCGWKLAQVRSQPSSQGSSKQLYIFTWANYTDRDLLNRFAEKTGIQAVANVFDSNEAMLAKLQAGGGGAYSIIYPSDYMVQKMIELAMLTQLDFSRITNIERLFPQFLNSEHDPGNLHSIPISWGTTGLIYNKQKLQKPPEDWSYLWDNKQQLTKRMTLLNDVREVMGAALKMLGYSYNSRDVQQIQQAYEKLAELKPSLASFTTDTWREQMLSGDLLIAMCYSSDANEVIEENKNLEYVLPKSGSSLWMDTLAIPKTAANPEGAYAWINFMLQPNVAAQICQRLSFATSNQAAFNLLPPEVKNNSTLFPSESELERCETLAPMGQLSEVYESYWTKLTSA
ncbi:MAG: spermidine/putrescine ABC transporter substrate-binding protein [Coleofasciculus sp. Co-bin14]|nr:spermidine/putrescine ABC transporter substrate-binding protein [Coleofasciculus sp. Co-bin14]